jgi:hypothetical protein
MQIYQETRGDDFYLHIDTLASNNCYLIGNRKDVYEVIIGKKYKDWKVYTTTTRSSTALTSQIEWVVLRTLVPESKEKYFRKQDVIRFLMRYRGDYNVLHDRFLKLREKYHETKK